MVFQIPAIISFSGKGVRIEEFELNVNVKFLLLYGGTYTIFLRVHRRTWEPTTYRVTRKLPFIPTEEDIDALIAGCGRKTADLLQLLKETGMRIGEVLRLRWTDVDLERGMIILNEPEKRGNPLVFKISQKLAKMLGALPMEKRVFGGIR